MAATIRVLKGSRQVEFPAGMSRHELVSIILKWAPKIAGDEDKTPYGITGSDPTVEKTTLADHISGAFDDVVDLLNGIDD